MNYEAIEYEQSVKLVEAGFSDLARYTVVKFTEDYIYDDDPEHPESHKAGEIRVYEFSWTKEDIGTNHYPCIFQRDCLDWFREHGYHVSLVPTRKGWTYSIYNIENIKNPRNITHASDSFEEYKDAVSDAIDTVLTLIIELNDAKNKRSL